MKIDLNDSKEKQQENKLVLRKSIKERKKLRSLVKESPKIIQKEEKKTNFKIFVASSIFVLLASYLIYEITKTCRFRSAYERNFNRLVYGDEYYCMRKLDTAEIHQNLKSLIVEQDDAIELIRGGLEAANRDKFVACALNGAIGTGKSLAVEQITRNFLWKGNIQKFFWGDERNFQLTTITQSLSKCGYNLIIIEKIDFNETSIEFITAAANELQSIYNQDLIRIIFIVIFNGSYEELETKDEDTISLQEKLKNFIIIDFKRISFETLMKCIEVNSKLLEIQLTPEELDDLKKIDYKTTGCKHVYSRISLLKFKSSE